MNRWSASLIGALIGAGAALLLAPATGDETRRRMRENLDDIQDLTQDQIQRGRMRVTELIQSGRDVANDLANRAQDQLPEVIDRTRQGVEKATDRAQRAVGNLSEQADEQHRSRPDQS